MINRKDLALDILKKRKIKENQINQKKYIKSEKEIEEELDRHPAKSVPEIIVMLKEKFEITITATPVRNWLKKRGIITDKPKRCRQKQMKRHRNIS